MTTTNVQSSKQSYQPIPIMENPESMPAATTRAADDVAVAITSGKRRGRGGDETDVSSVESGGLPSTYSSQQLMPPSETDRLEGGYDEAPSPPLMALRATARNQWFVVAVLCFVNMINYMDRFTIAGVLGDIQNDFKIGDDEAGLLQTAFIISYMVCAPIFGYLGDRYSRPWIMVIGISLWSTTTLLGSYMSTFTGFIALRALVGIGEASYSTIAPTIISDMFVNDMRSKMLAVFYFAIPVGSGFGYIVGSEMASFGNSWRWALRVTPALGIIAVLFILLIKDPKRGESEGAHNIAVTSYTEDLKYLVKNRSFMLSTAGFTCVAFVTGALAWWGPTFIYLGLKMQPGNENITTNDVGFTFGLLTMVAGILGVPLGSFLSQYLVKRIPNADPLVCGFGLLLSVPLMTAAMIIVSKNTVPTYLLIFFGQLFLNLNWAVIADILLYVVVPTRRSTAEAFQILISHTFGDAGSPYLVGLVSEAIKKHLRESSVKITETVVQGFESYSLTKEDMLNATSSLISSTMETPHALTLQQQDSNLVKFEALQYSLFSTCFVEVLGGIFFLITAAFILEDKRQASRITHRGGVPEID